MNPIKGAHMLTSRDKILKFLMIKRQGKATSYFGLCRECCFVKDLKGEIDKLKKEGTLELDSQGYRITKKGKSLYNGRWFDDERCI